MIISLYDMNNWVIFLEIMFKVLLEGRMSIGFRIFNFLPSFYSQYTSVYQ